MAVRPDQHLTRRERQMMDIVYRRGRATAQQVHADLPDPPGYTAVRTLLRILEEKGHLRHTRDGARYVYHPVRSSRTAGRSAIRRVVRTFFDDSTAKAVAALLDASADRLSDDELDRLAGLIERARQAGR